MSYMHDDGRRLVDNTTNMRINAIQAMATQFIALLDSYRTPPQPIPPSEDPALAGEPMAIGYFDPDINNAIQRVEEAAMWGMKHVTGLSFRPEDQDNEG